MDGDVDGLENETTVLRRMSAGRWTWLQEMETFDDPDHDLVRSVRDLDLERAQIIRQYGQVDRQYALSKRLMKRLHRDGKHISHQIKDAERLRDEIDAEVLHVASYPTGKTVCRPSQGPAANCLPPPPLLPRRHHRPQRAGGTVGRGRAG